MENLDRMCIFIGLMCLCICILTVSNVMTVVMPVEVHEDCELDQAVDWLNDGYSLKLIAVNGEELIIGDTAYHYKAVGDTIIEYYKDVPVKMINWNQYNYARYIA